MAEIEKKAVINIQTNGAEQNVGNLKKRSKELRDELARLQLAGQETSEEYQRLAQEAGDLARAQRLASQSVSEASTTFTNTIQYTAGAMAGVSGAVQTATSALSMMGVEMGEDSELMKKLVLAMSLTSGLQSIQSGVEAFKLLRTNIQRTTLAQKGLNTAIKANPIGFALTLAVALGGAFSVLAKNIWSSTKNIEKFNIEFDNMKQNQSTMENLISSEERYMKALGLTTEQIRKKQKAQLESQLAEAIAMENKAKMIAENQTFWDTIIGNASKAEEAYGNAVGYRMDLEEKLRQFNNNVRTEELENEKAKRDAVNKSWNDRKRQLEAEKASVEDIRRYQIEHFKNTMTEIEYNKALLRLEEDKLKVIEKEDEKKGLGYTSKAYIEQLKVIDNLTNAIKKLEQAEIDAMDKADMDTSKGLASELYNKDRLEADTMYMQRKKAIYESGETDISNMLNNLELQRFFNEKSLLEEQYNYGLVSKEEYEKQLTQIELEESEKRRQIADDERKKKEEITKLQQENIMALTSGVSSILGGIADNLKEDTEAYKNLKAAQAIIDTLSAAVSAFAGITAETSGLGIAQAIATATAVTATGMANVRKIYAVDTNGGANNASVSMGAVSTLNRNYSNTRLTDGSGTEVNLEGMIDRINDKKVYVSINDINEAQKQVTKTIVRNTF